MKINNLPPATYYSLLIALFIIIQFVVDKTKVFEFSGKEMHDNTASYKFYSNQLNERVVERLTKIETSEQYQRLMLVKGKKIQTNDNFDADLRWIFNKSSDLIRAMNYSYENISAVAVELERVIGIVAKEESEVSWKNMSSTLKTVNEEIKKFHAHRETFNEQQMKYKEAIEVASTTSEEFSTDLVKKNIELIVSLYDDDDSVLKYGGDIRLRFNKHLASTINFINLYSYSVNKYNERVKSDTKKQFYFQLFLVMLIGYLTIRKEIHSASKQYN